MQVLAKDVETRTAEQADMKGEVAEYMSKALSASEANSEKALAASDGALKAQLAGHVERWAAVLSKNEAAAAAEAKRLQTELDVFKSREQEQHASVEAKVKAMLQSVSDTHAAADEAAAALRAGLATTDARLSTTSTDIREMGSTDQGLVRGQIAEGLKQLKEDFAKDMAAQDAEMKAALATRRQELETRSAALESELEAKWGALNVSLVRLRLEQAKAAALHQGEVSDLARQDRSTRKALQTSMRAVASSLEAAQRAFAEPQLRMEKNETEGFKALLSKLNSAVQVLQASGVNLGADVDAQVMQMQNGCLMQ